MKRIFVSSCRIDEPQTAALIERLYTESFSVLHSPRNPLDGEDARWRDWYKSGCKAEMERASAFIAVISSGWGCSTWMAHECDEASKQMEAGKIRRMYFWNPEQIQMKAAGMFPYLMERLPDDLDQLISMLRDNG